MAGSCCCNSATLPATVELHAANRLSDVITLTASKIRGRNCRQTNGRFVLLFLTGDGDGDGDGEGERSTWEDLPLRSERVMRVVFTSTVSTAADVSTRLFDAFVRLGLGETTGSARVGLGVAAAFFFFPPSVADPLVLGVLLARATAEDSPLRFGAILMPSGGKSSRLDPS